MNYADIKEFDLINGTGVGVSLFVSGCNINCPGCFNKKAQNFNYGRPFTQEVLDYIIVIGASERIDHLSILGGEPLDKSNYQEVLQLVKTWKAVHPTKPIWLWTGYELGDIVESTIEIYGYLDYLIEGPYLRNLPTDKPFRGSDNQRLWKKVGNSSLLLATAKNKNQCLRIGGGYFIIVS